MDDLERLIHFMIRQAGKVMRIAWRYKQQILTWAPLYFVYETFKAPGLSPGSKIVTGLFFFLLFAFFFLLWHKGVRSQLFGRIAVDWKHIASLKRVRRVRGRMCKVLPLLARSGAKPPKRAGIVIGTPVAVGALPAEIRPTDNLYVVGPPRSGKTSQVILPVVRQWPGPVVATSTRRDVTRSLIGEGRDVKLIYVGLGNIDSTLADKLVTWDVLAGCGDPSVAVRRAKTLVEATASGESTGSSYWNTSATALLANLFIVAALLQLDIKSVQRWLQTGMPNVSGYVDAFPELAKVDAFLASYNQQSATAAAAAASTKSVAENALSWVNVMPNQPASGLDINAFVQSRAVLSLVYESGDAALAPYFSCLIAEIYLSAIAHAGQIGDKLRNHLLLALDELANLAPIADLPSWLSQSAGWGIQIMSIFQSTAQAEGRFGQAGAAALRDSSTLMLFLRGVNDLPTLQYLSQLAGRKNKYVTQTAYASYRRQSQTQKTQVAALSLDDLVALPAGRAIWVEGGRKVELIKLKYFKKGFG